MGLSQRDLQLHTYGDYLSWSNDVRYELIDGVAYSMSPARLHQELAGELYRQISQIDFVAFERLVTAEQNQHLDMCLREEQSIK